MNLPPLPHPRMQDEPRVNGLLTHWFTEDQMRAYGESCARMAREEERELTKAMSQAWCAQLEVFGMDQALALKIVTETVDKLVSAIRKGDLWGKSQVSDPAYQQAQREENERMRDLLDSIPIRKG